MTKLGQTDGFVASDFISEANKYLGASGKSVIDTAIVNTKRPAPAVLSVYKKEKAAFVEPDTEKIKKMGVEVISGEVISNHVHKKAKGDALTRSIIRHDAEKTAEIIWNLIK